MGIIPRLSWGRLTRVYRKVRTLPLVLIFSILSFGASDGPKFRVETVKGRYIGKSPNRRSRLFTPSILLENGIQTPLRIYLFMDILWIFYGYVPIDNDNNDNNRGAWCLISSGKKGDNSSFYWNGDSVGSSCLILFSVFNIEESDSPYYEKIKIVFTTLNLKFFSKSLEIGYKVTLKNRRKLFDCTLRVTDHCL